MNATARIGFAGTPDFASAILEALITAGYKPCVVYSQPDRPKGRGRRLVPSPVKALATANEIPVETPKSLRKPEAQTQFAAYQLDLLIVAAYGLILPQPILDAPRLGCVNVHASLLPRWRGAAPVERAIMAGDQDTGVALMQMDAGLDTGPVFRSARLPITDHTTGGELEDALAKLGAEQLIKLLPDLEGVRPAAQSDQGATYANKLTAEDSQINWAESAQSIDCQIRALTERAPARSSLNDLVVQVLAAQPTDAQSDQPPGTILSLSKRGLVVACGTGQCTITQAQLNRGKGKPMTAADLANGYADLLPPGAVFDAPGQDR